MDSHLRIDFSKAPPQASPRGFTWSSSVEPLYLRTKPRSAGPRSTTDRPESATDRLPSRHEPLPHHLRSVVARLTANLTNLKNFAGEMPRMTSTEFTAASVRLSALIRAQQGAVDDLALFTKNEIKFGKEKIAELNVQVKATENPVVRAGLASYRALYVLLHTLATTCAANEGFLLLLHASPHVRSVAAPPTDSHTGNFFDGSLPSLTVTPRGTNDGDSRPSSRQLHLVAHVSSSLLDSSNSGFIPSTVADICEAVVAKKTAVRIAAVSAPRGTPAVQRTILAVPIVLRGGAESAVTLGVVCLTGKAASTSASPATHANSSSTAILNPFTLLDECRCTVVADQLAVLLSSLPVGIAEAGEAPLTPCGFQSEWAEWSFVGPGQDSRSSPGGCIDYSAYLKPSGDPHRFVFRSDNFGPAVLREIEGAATRHVVDPALLLSDLVERLADVSRAAAEASARAEKAERALRAAEKSAADIQQELHVSRQDARDMRIACERVLRLAYATDASQHATPERNMADFQELLSSVASSIPPPPSAALLATPSNHTTPKRSQHFSKVRL